MSVSAGRDRDRGRASRGTGFMHPTAHDEQELWFSTSYLWPFLLLLPAVVCYYAALTRYRLPFLSTQWLFVLAIGTVFLVAAAFFLLFRESLVLNLANHSYAHRRGYWPNPTTREGPLNEFQAVALDPRPARGKEAPSWVVSLQFLDPARRIGIASFSGGAKNAYAFANELALKLHLPVLDRSGGEDQTTAWSEIDTPLVARPRLAPSSLTAPPSGEIRLSGHAPDRLIELPPIGINLGVVFLAALPAIMIWLGYVALTQSNGRPMVQAVHRQLHQQVQHPVLSPWAWAIAMFALAGLCIACLLFLCVARWQIRETADSIVVTSRAFGLRLRRRAFRKNEIVAIELKPTPAGRSVLYDVQIRSSGKLLTLGTTLTQDGAKWLEQAMLSMLVAA
ncbi:MAG TPA: hypothetical protein VF502_02775 [Stellaceae bacterium]